MQKKGGSAAIEYIRSHDLPGIIMSGPGGAKINNATSQISVGYDPRM